MDLFNQTDKGAIFSECKKYRYAIWRIWDKSKPYVMFIGLNPSTANSNTDDPTIRRVQKFAFDWGYGGVYMMNLFTFITPYPEKLELCDDHIEENNRWLHVIHAKCDRIIFAWGSFKQAEQRANYILERFKGFALEINKDGSPKHPLYVKSDIEPVKMPTPKFKYHG